MGIDYVDSQRTSQLGQDFGELIKEKLSSSHCVIAIISHNSERSVWVNQEIGFAEGSGKFILPMKEKPMADRGFGFIHSNIDAQLFTYNQQKFLKLNRFFRNEFKRSLEDVVKKPVIVKPIRESANIATRRSEPDESQ